MYKMMTIVDNIVSYNWNLSILSLSQKVMQSDGWHYIDGGNPFIVYSYITMLSTLNILTVLFVNNRLTKLKRKKKNLSIYQWFWASLHYRSMLWQNTSVVLKNNYIIYQLWIFKEICLPFLMKTWILIFTKLF